MSDVKQSLFSAILKLLRPLIRILLRYGVSHSEFSELTKRVYVQVAAEEQEFKLDARKQSTARVSVLTGLNRKEVSRLQKLNGDEGAAPITHNRAAQVVNGWLRDERYQGSKGNPLKLDISGDEPSFESLVKAYSGDIPVRAILDELLNVGAVEETSKGQVKLCSKGYIPQRCDTEKLRILGNSAYDLISTIAHNIPSSIDESRLQLTLAYNHLPKEALKEFQKKSQEHAHKTLLELNEWLSQRDRKNDPSIKGAGSYRAGLGIYYFEENTQEENNEV